VYGADMQNDMVKGTRENLEEYGVIKHTIKQTEIQKVDQVFDKNLMELLPICRMVKHRKLKEILLKAF